MSLLFLQTKFLSEPFGQRLSRFQIYTFNRSKAFPSYWIPRKINFATPSELIPEKWAQKITQAAFASKPRRPRKLLVIINPVGGACKALNIYKNIVGPVFENACIHVEVHTTQFSGHARDMLLDMSSEELSSFDGVVAVGGDGLFNEIINALLRIRAMNSTKIQTSDSIDAQRYASKYAYGTSDEEEKRKSTGERGEESISRATAAAALRLGHIPAGSTDAVACSLNGTRSVFSAAMRIALGDGVPLDVVRIDAADKSMLYAVCMASYGFMGDLMRESEKFRSVSHQRSLGKKV